MSLTEKDYELLHLYLEKQMTEDELADFEKQLATNDELRAELMTHRQIDDLLGAENVEEIQYESNYRKQYEDFVKNAENKSFYNRLKKISNEAEIDVAKSKIEQSLPKKNNTIGIRLKWLSGVAAAVLALYVFLPTLLNSGGEKLYAKYDNYDSLPSMTTKSGENSFYTEIEQDFQNKKYKSLIHKFETTKIAPSDEKSITRLYYNISLAETGKEEEAIENLDSLLKNTKDYTYSDWAEYYKAMFYLKKGDKAKAKELLSSIAKTDGHKKQKRAEEVLKALK